MENLTQNLNLTSEWRRENAAKAGRASVIARRRAKRLREVFSELMGKPVGDSDIKDALGRVGLEPSNANALCFQMVRKAALEGDVKAARYVRDTIGEKPTDTYNLGVTDKPIKSIDLTALTDAELEALADAEDD